MALTKALEINNSGLFGNYWRIRRVDADFPPITGTAVIQISVEGWISSEARVEGKNPLPDSRRVYRIECDSPVDVDGLTRSDLYAALKLEPDFYDSTDML